MQLRPKLQPGWPRLAWVADFCRGGGPITVHHGPGVEVCGRWCVEAVWAGEFGEGDFDRTDLVFGTGVRCRGDRAVFVTSGTTTDRLWHCVQGQRLCVANSLPALLAVSGVTLREEINYRPAIVSVREGLNRYQTTMPASLADIHVTYHHNLLYEGGQLTRADKPDSAGELLCYEDYYDYLLDAARALKRNLESPLRSRRIVPVTTVSSGYDSGAAAVIAREVGCREAVTIVNASSLLPRNDSGAELADRLGLACREYRHTPSAYKHEESVWAVTGRPEGLNLTVFDYPKPLGLLFTGYFGDVMWHRGFMNCDAPLVLYNVQGLGACELRLSEGFLHCPVPFWAGRHVRELQTISQQPAMEPWTLHQPYDRPVPRRILEDAGVPRELFGMRKEATSAESFFVWPFGREAVGRLRAFLRDRGLYAPRRATVGLLRRIVNFDHLLYLNVGRRFGLYEKGLRSLLVLKGQSLLFQWANHELSTRYRETFEPAPPGAAGENDEGPTRVGAAGPAAGPAGKGRNA